MCNGAVCQSQAPLTDRANRIDPTPQVYSETAVLCAAFGNLCKTFMMVNALVVRVQTKSALSAQRIGAMPKKLARMCPGGGQEIDHVQ